MNKTVKTMMSVVACAAISAVCLGAFAEGEGLVEESERETFGKWHVGVGPAFNGGVKAWVGTRNMPVPPMHLVPAGFTRADAWRRAHANAYDGGGYIAPDSLDNGFATENWKLPTSDYRGNGKFDLKNAYQDVVGSTVGATRFESADAEMQYGVSVEFSREVWIHDEEDEHRWGVDFAAAFSYFFQRNVYSAHGVVTRTDDVQDGAIHTPVDDADAMWRYDHGYDRSIGGLYGHGNFDYDLNSPALGWASIGAPFDAGGPSHPVASSYGYHSSGDYRELEMLFMLRPWYEITDWWRVFAEVGVGVSWGRFDSCFKGGGIHSHESSTQWDVYGVAGLGTMIRYGSWDLGVDFVGRFLRDNLDVDGKYVDGTIRRSPWGFRVMVGYSF